MCKDSNLLSVSMRLPRPRLFLLAVCATLLLAACGGEDPTPAAMFARGSRVRLIGDSSSVVLVTTCGSPFSRLAGVANAGDEAAVKEREYCEGGWWYEVQVTALEDEDWQGIGWAPEENLKAH